MTSLSCPCCCPAPRCRRQAGRRANATAARECCAAPASRQLQLDARDVRVGVTDGYALHNPALCRILGSVASSARKNGQPEKRRPRLGERGLPASRRMGRPNSVARRSNDAPTERSVGGSRQYVLLAGLGKVSADYLFHAGEECCIRLRGELHQGQDRAADFALNLHATRGRPANVTFAVSRRCQEGARHSMTTGRTTMPSGSRAACFSSSALTSGTVIFGTCARR